MNYPLDNAGFVWVKRPSGIELAYYDNKKFQDPYTVGDREGLSVDYYDDVLAWMDLKEPELNSREWVTL